MAERLLRSAFAGGPTAKRATDRRPCDTMAEGSAASLQQWLAQEANAVRARLEVFDPQAADPDTPPPPLGRVGEGARGELEWLRRAEWVSHRTRARWSGSNDELKAAWTRQLQRLRNARKIRPADDGTRRVEQRRASATQRAAHNGARDARREQLAEQRRAARQLAEEQREQEREQQRKQRYEQKLVRLNAQRAKQKEAAERRAASKLELKQAEQEAQRRRHVRIIKFDYLNVDTPKHGKRQAKVLILDSKETLCLSGETWRAHQAGFEYVRGIHGRVGLDRWLRVITDDEDEDDVKREVGGSLTMCGRTYEHINGRA